MLAILPVELGRVALAFLEGFQDPLDDAQALGRVAVLDLAADDFGAAGKNPFRPVRVVSDAVVFVDEGDVHGEPAEHQIDLLGRQAPLGQADGFEGRTDPGGGRTFAAGG